MTMSAPRRSNPQQGQHPRSHHHATTPPPPTATATTTATTTKSSRLVISIPISLGKPSLKQRMEAYYSLINPSILCNNSSHHNNSITAWTKKFDEIFQKYGGSMEGEKKLALKLRKKYGDTVLLRTVSDSQINNKDTNIKSNTNTKEIHDESYYDVKLNEYSSSIQYDADVTSVKFDPVAALRMNEYDFLKQFHQEQSPKQLLQAGAAPYLLDNVGKFRFHLPDCDPQKLCYKNYTPTIISIDKKQEEQPKKKRETAFTTIASNFKTGPFSLLHDSYTNQTPIKVMIRYIDCIRGTITGTILAFDKHCNLILKNVCENYSPRMTKHLPIDIAGVDGNDYSNYEVEVYRRLCLMSSSTASPFLSCNIKSNEKGQNKEENNNQVQPQQKLHDKKRMFKQILVRGDNVVMIWKAS